MKDILLTHNGSRLQTSDFLTTVEVFQTTFKPRIFQKHHDVTPRVTAYHPGKLLEKKR